MKIYEPVDGTLAKAKCRWHEDIGPVLWWFFPLQEPPYVGTPLDDNFPDYVTHWTPIPVPKDPHGT